MSADRPSLEAQAARWHELNDSAIARMLRKRADDLVHDARALGFRVEIVNVPDGCAMGAYHEEIIVTPSREGYQSTT
jgi:hypothetical protein